MKKSRFIKLVLLSVLLGVTSACSDTNMKGMLAAIEDLDFSADRALLNAASAALQTTDSTVMAYEQAMQATNVKNDTVEDAIRAYRASRQGGFEGQLETAYSTTVIIIDSGIADQITQAASDPGFRRSWAEVEPFFDRSQAHFQRAGHLQGYATTKFAIGGSIQGYQVHQGLSGDGGGATKIASAVVGVHLLTQVVEIVPKLLSNYEELNKLDVQLMQIPNYAQASKDREASGGELNQIQIAAFNSEADRALETKEPVFTSLFEDEPKAEIKTASKGTGLDAKLSQAKYCRKVQSGLKSEGHYRGKVDGLCGPGSRRAISAFKRKNGLGINNVWTKEAEEALFAKTVIKLK